jgi:hypothetical protein
VVVRHSVQHFLHRLFYAALEYDGRRGAPKVRASAGVFRVVHTSLLERHSLESWLLYLDAQARDEIDRLKGQLTELEEVSRLCGFMRPQ